MRRFVLAASVSGVMLLIDPQSGLLAAQDAGPTFRAETTVVEVDARVVDPKGHFVPDLTADDFELYEDDIRQPLTGVELVTIPRVGGAETDRLAMPSDVSSNQRTAAQGRYYLLVLDDLHTSVGRSQALKDIARRFVTSSVGPNDRVAIVTTSGRTGPSHDFTTNQKRLLAAIDRIVGQKGVAVARLEEETAPSANPGSEATSADRLASSRTLPNSRASGRAGSDPLRPPDESAEQDEEGRLAASMVRSLRNWVIAMAGLPAHTKSVVWLSEGIAYNTANGFGRWSSTIESYLTETIAAATRNNVTIYAVDPRGNPTGKKTDIALGLPDADSFSLESWRMKGSLSYVAGGTGGFALTSSNDFGGAFRRIADESGQYYILRYSPSPTGNAIRRIRVVVHRPQLMVRSRSQVAFQQPTATPTSQERVARVLSTGLPQAGFTMAVTTSAWRRHETLVGVLVTVGCNASDVWTDSSATRTAVFRLVAIDGAGEIKANREISLTDLPSDVTTFEVVSELELRPGDYQLRVGAVSADGRVEGSVYHDMTVPNLNARPLALGDPLIASGDIGHVFVDLAGPRPAVFPTTQRSFTRAEDVRVSGTVFVNDRRTPAATADLSAAGTDRRVCARATSPLESGPEGLAFTLPLAFIGCRPGSSALVVDVRAAQPSGSWRRSVPIEILQAEDEGEDETLPPVPTAQDEPTPGPVTLEALLTRAADYVQRFTGRFTNVVTEERYEQHVSGRSVREERALQERLGRPAPITRELVSDFLLVKLPSTDAWVPFRDVFLVDGQPVRERQDRLTKLLLQSPATALDQARDILNESARYNIGEVERTINTPLLALAFLDRDLQSRFRFRLGREDVSMGPHTWTVSFQERTSPSVIHGQDGRDLSASGRVWLEDSGRVSKTELILQDRGLRAVVTTTFRADGRFDLNVPVEMIEDYRLPSGQASPAGTGQKHITGRASYGRFRRFDVTSTEEFGDQPR